MCGISGAIGPKINIEKIKTLGLLNNERGGDAAGVYTKNTCVKTINNYYDLMLDKDYPTKPGKFILSHTRKGSSGSNTLQNAQPLVSGKDVFALNGTIKNLGTLEKTTGVPSEVLDNDTSYLLKLLQSGDTSFLEYYVGGATFVYRTKNKTTFWIGESANSVERPLHFCYIGDTMYFSSLARDLEVIAEGSPIKHFKTNTLITISDNASITNEVEIDRHSPVWALSNLQRQALALPYVEEFSTLDSMANTNKNKILYCGGAYYYEEQLYTGSANLSKEGNLSWCHENNTQARYKFINGILLDIKGKPSDQKLKTTALSIGIIDDEYDFIQENISPNMLHYNADLGLTFFQDQLADGVIQPMGSSTYYHFEQGVFTKMTYYSTQDFMDKVEELHLAIDHLLYEFDKEDLDSEGITIFETLENYKEYAESNYKEWV